MSPSRIVFTGLFGCLTAGMGQGTEVRELLTELWSSTRQAREAVDTLMADQGEVSPELQYAHALVLTRQRRFREATTALGTLVGESAVDPRARQLRIWLLLVQGESEAALAELNKLAGAWDALRQEGDISMTELAGWVGRAMAVLEGPRDRRAQRPTVDATLGKLLSVVRGEERAALESGRTEVLKEFKDRLMQLQDVQVEEESLRAEQRQDESTRLSEQVARVDQQLADLQTQMQDVREQFAEQRRPVEAAAPGIAGAVVESERREAVLSWQVNALQGQIEQLSRWIAKEADPARRRQLEAQQEALIVQLQWEGYSLDQAAADRAGSRMALQQAHNELISNRNAEAQEQDQLARRRQALIRSQNQAQRRQDRLAQPDRRISGRVRSMRRSLEAVTTYLDFPLEAERARLLR